MASEAFNSLKNFVMTNQLLEHDLDRIEAECGIDLHRGHVTDIETDEDYYPQIESRIRVAAAEMAPHYEVLYSLESTIRALLVDTLRSTKGEQWWDSGAVPTKVKTEAESRKRKEIDTGMTPRSDDMIDFTTFGELSEVIKHNWDVFGGMFSSIKAVEKVMSNLNSIRGPIAHCGYLAEDEVLRLRLAVRDWFRLMD